MSYTSHKSEIKYTDNTTILSKAFCQCQTFIVPLRDPAIYDQKKMRFNKFIIDDS